MSFENIFFIQILRATSVKKDKRPSLYKLIKKNKWIKVNVKIVVNNKRLYIMYQKKNIVKYVKSCSKLKWESAHRYSTFFCNINKSHPL